MHSFISKNTKTLHSYTIINDNQIIILDLVIYNNALKKANKEFLQDPHLIKEIYLCLDFKSTGDGKLIITILIRITQSLNTKK